MALRITEQFYTIQGEGRSVGKSAYFIRFAGCNLRCQWCDSMHSVDPHLFKDKTFEINYSEIPANCNLVVLTGGEPTLFDLQEVRKEILSLNSGASIEVESNATNFPEGMVDDFVWNLSPKLRSSKQENPSLDAKRLTEMQKWADYAKGRQNVTFKFVVTGKEDLAEILELQKKFNLEPRSIYLMAQGSKKQDHDLAKTSWIIDHCKDQGYNFSPRLHIILWGDKRGV